MSLLAKMLRRFAPPSVEQPVAAQVGKEPTLSKAPVAAPAGPAAVAPPVKPPKRFPGLPGSDEALLARMGEEVRARLAASPGVEAVPAFNMDMFIVRDFMSEAECAEMMALTDADAKPSTRLGTRADPNFRTSHTCRFSAPHPLVAEIERRIADLLGLPPSHSETIQGQRYYSGQQFKMHNDYFAGGQPYSETVAAEGGQRTWTAMVFLNRPEAGGATNFPRALVRVPPEPGALLIWNNMDREGLPNPYTHHEGSMVEAGTKYVLTKWFREREWHTSAASDAMRE